MPLRCPAPLVRQGDVCVGCPPGAAGTPGACAACAQDELCPGLLSRALPGNFTALWAPIDGRHAGAGDASAIPAACRPLAAVVGPSLESPINGPLATVAAVLVGCAVGSLTILLYLCTGLGSEASAARSCLARWLPAVDQFSTREPQIDGEPLVKQSTGLGGLFSVLSVVTMATMAVVLTVRRADDNVLVQQSLNVLEGGATPTSASAAWASTAQPGGTSVTGLRIRVLAHGEPDRGCAMPLTWSSSGLRSGSWALETAPDCGDGATAALAFSCPACFFTGESALEFVLPFSCQELELSAMAVDAAGGMALVSVPLASSRAAPGLADGSSGGGLLSTLAWQLAPLYGERTDQLNSRATRGYQMVGVSVATTLTPLAQGLPSIKPAEESVVVRIVLPLQPFYSSTVLSEKVSTVQLVTSIFGLTGVFALFGVGFKATLAAHDSVCKRCRARQLVPRALSRKRIAASGATGAPPSEASGGAAGGGSGSSGNTSADFAAANPLRAAELCSDVVTSPTPEPGSSAKGVLSPPPPPPPRSSLLVWAATSFRGTQRPLSQVAAIPTAPASADNAAAHSTQLNPLHAQGTPHGALPPADEHGVASVDTPAPKSTKWTRYADDSGDVWFVNAATGEAVWKLPPGGVLVSSGFP